MAVKYPNSKQFRRELDDERLERRYLFLGEEEGEKEKFIERICRIAIEKPLERKNSTGRYHVDNDEFMAAADFALSPSMFSSRRICVMYGIDSLSAGSHGAVLHELIETLPDTSVLIMTSRENRPPPFMKPDILDRMKIVQFWRYFDSDIFNYIAMSFKRLGMEIDERAVTLLIDRTGNDIKKIDDAIDMIRFSGVAGPVTLETVRDSVDDVKDASVFNFVDLLFKRDPRALALCKKIHEEGTPALKTLYLVVRQAEMLEKYYSLVEEGVPVEESMKQAGVFSKNKENFWRYTELFPPHRLKRVFSLLGGADYALKSGGKPRELLSDPVFNLASEMIFSA